MNFTRPISNATSWHTVVTSAGDLPRGDGAGHSVTLPPLKSQRIPGGNPPIVITGKASRRVPAPRRRGALPTP